MLQTREHKLEPVHLGLHINAPKCAQLCLQALLSHKKSSQTFSDLFYCCYNYILVVTIAEYNKQKCSYLSYFIISYLILIEQNLTPLLKVSMVAAFSLS